MYSQIPVNDPAWILETSLSEEFNSPLNFTNKWFNQWPWGDQNFGGELSYPSNLIETGTTLEIKLDTLIPSVHRAPSAFAHPDANGVHYVYQSGAIQSRPNPLTGKDYYKYGYFETYARFPSSGCYPLWPAFWLWSADCSAPYYYNEIDIAENAAANSFAGNKIGTGILTEPDYSDCNIEADDFHNGKDIILNTNITHNFHKYAVQWNPDWVTWYFDDVPIRSFYDPRGIYIPQNPMAVIFDFAIDEWWAFLPSDWNDPVLFPGGHGNSTPVCVLPKTFEIDYFRYYTLKTDCSTDLDICDPIVDYPDRDIKKTISVGGSLCSTDIYTSDSFTFRATDFVLLDEHTSIKANGTGFFAIDILACPQ